MSKKDTVNETVSNETAGDTNTGKTKTGMKKFKYGSMSIAVLCLVVAIVVVINVMVGMLAKRSPVKIDLTPDKRYDLSDESIEALKNLDSDVEIVVTMKKDFFTTLANYYKSNNVDVPFDMIPVILEKYEMYAKQGSGSVDVTYVDMDKDPDVISKYSANYNGEISQGSIVVASGDRVKVIDSNGVMNMITTAQNAASSSNPQFVFAGESTLTSAITSVTDSNPISVAFVKTTNGTALYSENEYSAVVDSLENDLLEKNGYDCTDIDIATDELDTEKYDMIVVPTPSADFNEDIIKKLSDFLYNDGNYDKSLLYVPSLTQTNLPNIDEFLADWSIKVENNIIADDINAISTQTNIVATIADSDSVGTLPNDSLPIVAPLAREVSVITKNNEDVVKTILQSSDNSFTVDLDTKEQSSDRGSHGIAVMSQKQHAEQLDVYKSSVLVLGSAYMASSEILTQNTTYNNANVILGILNNMTGKEAAAVIPEKSLQSSYIAVTQTQGNTISIIVIWAIPLLIAAIGVVVLVRRRNR